jgi:predicted O-methyltransferase YrrM
VRPEGSFAEQRKHSMPDFMNPNEENISSSFELQKALDYIGVLLPATDSLQTGPTGLPGEHLQPTVGLIAAVLLEVLVRSVRPRRILEIGTSYGFSACVLGRAAASYGGTVTSIELNERLADVARTNVKAANLERTVEIILADARKAIFELDGPFGLILQDGDKDSYLAMLDRLTELLEPRGLLITDDVLFPVMALPESAQGWRAAVAAYNTALKGHPLLRTVWLPIGDGVAVSVKQVARVDDAADMGGQP